jgi:hypothetical protein
VGPYAVREFFRELQELFVHVPTAGHEPAAMALDDRERAEPVVLQFKQAIQMIESRR